MIGGVSGVSQMIGVSAIRPYGAMYQNMGYGQVKAVSRNIAGQNAAGAVKDADAASGASAGRSAGMSLAVSGMERNQRIGAVWAGRAANTGIPVEPVSPVDAVRSNGAKGIAYAIPFLRAGADPAEMAVRMRMKSVDSSKECQTCKERKYQDGSDDAGVSYQTPTHIAPEQAASAVRGHEMEHVVREQAAAEREDRRVVSQSVTMHTAICPECGRVYVSGGTTRTTTASDSQPEQQKAVQEPEEGFSEAA